MNQERLTLTVTEAAQALGLGKNTAYELVRSGRLKSVKVGRKLLIPRRELSDFLVRESEQEIVKQPWENKTTFKV